MTREEFAIQNAIGGERLLKQMKDVMEDQEKFGITPDNHRRFMNAAAEAHNTNALLVEQLSPEDVLYFYPNGWPPPPNYDLTLCDVLAMGRKKEQGMLN